MFHHPLQHELVFVKHLGVQVHVHDATSAMQLGPLGTLSIAVAAKSRPQSRQPLALVVLCFYLDFAPIEAFVPVTFNHVGAARGCAFGFGQWLLGV
jgi:hypothetical protein